MRMSGLSNDSVAESKINWMNSDDPTHSSTTVAMHAMPVDRIITPDLSGIRTQPQPLC